MTPRNIAMAAGLMLALSGGAAFAQLDGGTQDSFYADPVLPDPPVKAEHVFPASVATQDVAAVTPAAGEAKPREVKTAATARNSRPASGCTALNPCAVSAPAARS